MGSFSAQLIEIKSHARGLLRSNYFVVIAEVFLMTALALSSFAVLVRLTDIKTVGLWILLNSLLSFSKMADFWSAGLVTFVAEEIQFGRAGKASRLVSTSVITAATAVLGVICGVGVALSIFAQWIPGVEDTKLVQSLVPLMCITFWLLTVGATYQVGFLGFNRPIFKLIQNVGGSLCFLILSLFLVPHYGLWGILFAQAAQGFLMLGFGSLVFHGHVAKSNPLAWAREDFGRLTNYGSKASVVGFLQLASEPIIRLLASNYGGLAAVTQIELATRMIVAVRGLIMSVGQLLVPEFARTSVQDKSATVKLYAKARQVFVLVTIPVLACLLCVAPMLERILLVHSSPEFLPMVWMLSFGWAFNIITAPAFFLLTGQRRLRPLFWNRLLMLLAVSAFGMLGGQLFGILGVTFGVTVGLILASVFVYRVAREFDPPSRLGTGIGFRFSHLYLLLFAALTNVAFVALALHGFPPWLLVLVTFLGLLATLVVAAITTPIKLLGRFGVVNAEL